MDKIKVLFTIPNFTSAGSGREMFNIIEHLDKNLFDISIAVQKSGGALFKEIESKGYNLLVQSFFIDGNVNVFNKIIAAVRLANTFTKYHFDIWQSFNWSSDYTEPIVAALAGAKFCYVKKNMNWNRRAWKVKSLLSKRIIARNTTMTETFLSKWPYKKKVKLIQGGVDTGEFIPGTVSGIKTEFTIPSNSKLISCVAQLVRIKDHITLIKAVSTIDNVYLILAGTEKDVEYAEELKDLAKELNIEHRVIFAGSTNKINALLNASDIFVLPTSKLYNHEEGCPVALLEAMSAGTPAIASNIAGSNDLIKNEQTGLLFEQRNVEELTACIRRYFSDNTFAENMVQNAREKILSHHTLDIEAKAFSDLYKAIA